MPDNCAIVENGRRCQAIAYTLVRDPTASDGRKHPICAAHFQRAFYRAEILWFRRPPRTDIRFPRHSSLPPALGAEIKDGIGHGY